MAQFVTGDLSFISSIVSDECFTPSKPWSRRADKPIDKPMPDTITVDNVAHPLRDIPIPMYSAEWWFIYFFDQAKSLLNKLPMNQRTVLATFFNTAFVKPDGLRNDLPDQRYIIPRGPLATVFAGNFAALRAGLSALLVAGFESIEQGPNGVQVSSEALRKYALNIDKKVYYKLVWRGGEREWGNIRNYGYAPAARYEADAIAWNMRQEWHPFYEVSVRSKVYYRKAFTDNCLFTAVSVTDDWKCAICYPKIEQTTELMEIQKKVKLGRTLEELKSDYPKRIARVVYSSSFKKDEYHIVTVTRAALMVLEGIVLDTKQRQKDTRGPTDFYPELGAQTIVGDNVFAMVEYVRIFHGVEDKDGFTAFYRPSGAKLVNQSDVIVAFGDSKALTEYYRKILDEVAGAKVNRISLCWTAQGTGTPSGLIDYWSKLEFGDGTVLTR
ncbi:MAG: hypothetical protein H6974_10350 [Gammaproteobacteria bacterium]|nr:hypothetical protein [Gammaproteobacteria bacterium]